MSDLPNRRATMSARHRAAGFTILETTVALVILAVAMVMVAQLSFWSLRERAGNTARQVALEQAANVLEAVRALPWDSLTQEWAAQQRIPEDLAVLLPSGRVTVTVEPEESLPRAKRVSVEVRWLLDEGMESQPVHLVSLFTSRSNGKEERTP